MNKTTQLLLALAVVLLMPMLMQSGSLASEVLIFGLAAMACNLLLGYTGLLSFGQGIFFGLGSYTIALTLTRWPLPMPVALLLAMVAGGAGRRHCGLDCHPPKRNLFCDADTGLCADVLFLGLHRHRPHRR